MNIGWPAMPELIAGVGFFTNLRSLPVVAGISALPREKNKIIGRAAKMESPNLIISKTPFVERMECKQEVPPGQMGNPWKAGTDREGFGCGRRPAQILAYWRTSSDIDRFGC